MLNFSRVAICKDVAISDPEFNVLVVVQIYCATR